MTTAMYGEQSQHLDELFTALGKFQGAMTNVERNRDGEFGPYADLPQVLSAIRKPLSANDLCFTQPVLPFGSDGTLAVVTTLGHKSGQYMRSAVPLTAGLPIHELHAEVTQARRMALSAVLGIAADWDDDGKESKQKSESAKAQQVNDSAHHKRAVAALRAAKGEADRVVSIYALVDEQIAAGKMNQSTKDKLLEEFPMPEEVADAR
jgi:hypothetical protein